MNMRKFKSKNQDSISFQKQLNSEGLYAERKRTKAGYRIYLRNIKTGKAYFWVKGSRITKLKEKKQEIFSTENTIQTTRRYKYDKNKTLTDNFKSLPKEKSNTSKFIILKTRSAYYDKKKMKKEFYISSQRYTKNQSMAELDLREKLANYRKEYDEIESIEIHEIMKR